MTSAWHAGHAQYLPQNPYMGKIIVIPILYIRFYTSLKKSITTQIVRFMGPTCGPPGTCRPQMGPMMTPWTLLSGKVFFPNIARDIQVYIIFLDSPNDRIHAWSGPLFTIKEPFYGYRNSHYKPKAVCRPPQGYDGNLYTNKSVSS